MFPLLLELFAELLSPSRCAACEEPVRMRTLFCSACAATVERFEGAPDHRAAFVYGGAIATAIARFKYAGRVELGHRLGAILAVAALATEGEVDVVAPVPLHPRKLAARGYNQSALLARPLAQAIGARFEPRLLARTRLTEVQASLTREARKTNVAGAFACAAAARGQRILLVDDVTTTGATLQACRTALVSAGAADVICAVLASHADALSS